MPPKNIFEAVDELKQMLRSGKNLSEAISSICEEYSVTEPMLRHWFLKTQDGETPEEYAADQKKRKDVSIDTAISDAASGWIRDRSRDFVGRSFFLDITHYPGKITKQRWYRYIGYTGYQIVVIDEETLKTVKLTSDHELWTEVHKKLLKAQPYEHASSLQFSGDNPELAERDEVLWMIRMELLTACHEDSVDELSAAFEERLQNSASLTSLYHSLSKEQRERIRVSVNNPMVDMVIKENGKNKHVFLERGLALLRRLNAGEIIPKPPRPRLFQPKT